MLHSTILLALATGLCTADFTGRSVLKGSQANLLPPGANSIALASSANCDTFEDECDGYCIPSGEVCCGDGDGSYCKAGKYCQPGGCCPKGEICTGDASGCDDDKELCGSYCIPEDSVCCDDSGSYCYEGEVCTNNNECEPEDDSGSPTSAAEGSADPTGTTSDAYFSVPTETSSSDSISTDSSVSVPSSTGSPSLCRRKKGGGVHIGGDDDDDDDSDGCDDDDDVANGVTIPVALAGFVALGALFL